MTDFNHLQVIELRSNILGANDTRHVLAMRTKLIRVRGPAKRVFPAYPVKRYFCQISYLVFS